MENSNMGFAELEVWKKARGLKKKIWLLVKRFPNSETYKLTDQIIRSSRSICSCISEGHGRFSFKDQLHFCIIARGSLSETHNHLIDALDCEYISLDELSEFETDIKEISKLLNGYIKYLRTQILQKNASK